MRRLLILVLLLLSGCSQPSTQTVAPALAPLPRCSGSYLGVLIDSGTGPCFYVEAIQGANADATLIASSYAEAVQAASTLGLNRANVEDATPVLVRFTSVQDGTNCMAIPADEWAAVDKTAGAAGVAFVNGHACLTGLTEWTRFPSRITILTDVQKSYGLLVYEQLNRLCYLYNDAGACVAHGLQ